MRVCCEDLTTGLHINELAEAPHTCHHLITVTACYRSTSWRGRCQSRCVHCLSQINELVVACHSCQSRCVQGLLQINKLAGACHSCQSRCVHCLLQINELAGACHSCKSRHYSGLAVDLHNDARSQEYIDKCNAMGGLGIDEHNHIHCQFYDGPHPNW